MSYTQQYEDYTNSYDNIINVLTEILESGEITPGSQERLEEAYVDYNQNYADTLKTLQSIKDSTTIKRIEDIEIKKIDADKKSIIDILTNNGVNNSIYLDDDNNVIINGEAVPELNQVKLTIDEQNKKIESIVSGGEIEIDGEKKSVQVAFSDLKQTVDGISTTVTDFKQTVEGDYYNKEQTTAQITTKANEITNTVASTYATKETVENMGSMVQQKTDEITSTVASLQKDLDDNYSTTSEVTSQITQKADEITGSMSKTYATKDSVTNLDTTLQTKIGEVSSTVSSVKKDLADNYTNNTDLASQLLQTENNIKATVSETYATKDSVQTNASQIEQNAKKISMVVASDSTESNVILTDNALTAISNNVNISADHIRLEGYTTINGGFKVDEQGNIEATNANISGKIIADSGEISSNMKVSELNVEGNLSADTLTIRNLNCQNVSSLLVDDVDITIDADNGSDLTVFKDEAVYATLQGCLEAMPKNLNGNTVTVTLNSVATENIVIKGFNGGILIIKLNKNIEGNIKGQNCSAEILINGSGSTTSILKYNYKITGNLNMREGRGASYALVTTIPPDTKVLVTDIQEQWGYTTYNGYSGYISLKTSYTTAIEEYDTTSDSTEIKPSALIESDGNKYSTYFENCNYVEMNNINVYGKTETNAFTVGSDKASNVKLNGIRVTGSQNGVHALNMGRIIEINTSGKVSNVAHKASLGGVINIENGTMINGSMDCSNSSQIIYSSTGAVKDNTTTDVGSNDNTTTATSTITIKSNSGDTYRSTVYNNWKNDNTARQGDYGYGDCNGCWFFGTQFAKQLQGKTIKKLTLKVTRNSGGISGSATCTLRMHNYASKPASAPTYISGWSQDFSATMGASTTITITDSTVLSAIKNGTCKGFGVKGTYDKTHYAVFSGSCTLTAVVE